MISVKLQIFRRRSAGVRGEGGNGAKTVDAYALYVSVPILPVIEENRIPDCLETAKSPRVTTVRARHCIPPTGEHDITRPGTEGVINP